jgi:hypothetical protein
MSTVDVRGSQPGPGGLTPREVRKSEEVVAGGGTAEIIGGAAAVVLSIIGLAKLFPDYMAAISSIAAGGALILEAGAIAARFRSIVAETGSGQVGEAELGGGLSAEFLGGAAGVVLGILALLNVMPGVLLGVSAIALGGTLLLSSGANARLNDFAYAVRRPERTAQEIARDAVMGAIGLQVIAGLGSVVLGILALIGFTPLILTLIAFLSIGGAIVLTGSALAGRMISLLRL